MARWTEPINLDLPIERPRSVSLGGGSWPFYLDRTHEWAWQDGIFSDLELDAIIEIGNRHQIDRASTYGVTGPEVRSSNVAFIYPNESTDWIFRKMTMATDQMNREYFGFDLSGFEQGFQFTRYEAPGEHYEWHVDRGRGIPVRKLSVTVQLSDPATYEGGDLQISEGLTPATLERKRGRLTFFPSWIQHRVTPVTSGIRYSLVAWIGGPPFR